MTQHEMAECGNAHHVHRGGSCNTSDSSSKIAAPETRPNPGRDPVCVLRQEKKMQTPESTRLLSAVHPIPTGTNVPNPLY
jgi:hypothetical protein